MNTQFLHQRVLTTDEHPTYPDLAHPPRFAADFAIWENRPSLTWVRKIYCQYR